MIDNTALMQINFDSSLNEKLVNKNRHNKRMIGSPSKDQIDLSFPELSSKRIRKVGNIIITDSERPSRMNVQKDGLKIQNKRLSVRDF